MSRLKLLYQKYRELVLYILFGGLTTLVNIFVYVLCARLFVWDVTLSTVIAWVLSVLFAYITNRKWVFQSRASGGRAVFREILTFSGGRAASGALDILNMYVFVGLLHINDLFIKILSNIVVIILNYIISKLIVFQKKN